MEVSFTDVPLWVQTHGLVVGQTTRNKAGWAARKVGKVLDVDFRSQRAVWVTPFVRVKVLIDVSKSLCPGFFLPRVDRAPASVQFKFERIFGFCFNCGRIGHMTSTCCNPSSVRVDPDYFSSRMFAMVKDYRRFSGTSLSGNRSPLYYPRCFSHLGQPPSSGVSLKSSSP